MLLSGIFYCCRSRGQKIPMECARYARGGAALLFRQGVYYSEYVFYTVADKVEDMRAGIEEVE